MRSPGHSPSADAELEPSQSLIADLRALEPARNVPPSVDAAVLATARPWFIRQRRRRLILRYTIIGTGAAAASILLLAAFLPSQSADRARQAARQAVLPASDALVEMPPAHTVQPSAVSPIPGHPPSEALAGRVTILDAFALARHLKAGDAMHPQWDANRDGVVDRKDVDALAMAAVRVVGGS